MGCSECRKLKLQCQHATTNYMNLLRMRNADIRDVASNEPTIWDFALDAALKARDDAQRTLADHHREKHKSLRFRSASAMIVVLISQSDIWELSLELWGTLAF